MEDEHYGSWRVLLVQLLSALARSALVLRSDFPRRYLSSGMVRWSRVNAQAINDSASHGTPSPGMALPEGMP